jgi:hypothetical protein
MVKDFTEYSNDMSKYELFSFLYDRISSNEVTTFSKLKELVAPALQDKWTHPVIMKAFDLLKRLYWGFFDTITPNTHKKLWQELVIPDKDFPKAGDLKKTLQISNLYVAMLDIHGYTNFCMESRKNLSMMHALDWAIENEIRRISTLCGAVSQRERGDEMVVVAASATDALMTTLCIIDYFGKTKVVKDPNISTAHSDDTIALPTFKISAGITGGNTTSPLIITEKGNLSGFLLNSGARLQTRANELSPKESRVMIAKQVQMNFMKENAQTPCSLLKNNAVYFFDTGHIEFKGVMIPTYEVIFSKEDHYKEQFSEELVRLFDSVKENLWEQKIFQDMMDLLTKVIYAMPKFSVTPSVSINDIQIITNESLMHLCRIARQAYLYDEDYPAAVNLLQSIISVVELIPSFDRLVLDYLRGVTDKYVLLLDYYQDHIDREIDEKADRIFQGNDYKTWVTVKKGVTLYEKLRSIGRKSNEIAKKKNLWYSLIRQFREKMVFTLYSGKK